MERGGEIATEPSPVPIVGLALIAGLVVSLLSILLNDQITSDAARYYGPLAREFGAGNYDRAFFHMVPPLTPLLAGLLVKAGIDAFTALKLVSCFFYLAAMGPLYLLARRIVTPRAAAWCCVLYAISPYIVRYGTAGSLEAAKLFFLLLAFQQTVAYWEDGKWRCLMLIGGAAAALALSRGEGIFYAPLLLFIVLIADLRRSVNPFGAVMHTLAVAGICILLSGPWLVYQYRATGYPVWYSRHAWLVQWFEFKRGETDAFPRFSGIPPEAERVIRHPERAGISPSSKFRQTVKALYPPFLLLTLFGLYVRLRGKYATGVDLIVAAVILFHIALFWLGPSHVSKRYIAPATPFLLPWTMGGIAYLLSMARHPVMRKFLWGLGGLTLIAILVHGIGAPIRDRIVSGPPTEQVVGLWIREDADRFDVNPGPPLRSASWDASYHNGRQPVIATARPQYAYWAAGDLLLIRRGFRYPFDLFLDLCASHHVDVIVADEHLLETCPGFDGNDSRLQLLSDRWVEEGILLYGLATH